MLWSVVSFLTDAECANQDQVTDWTDPETNEITDSILGEYIFPYKCLSKELPFITPASFLISFCISFGFFSDASAQEDHVVNDIGESTFEETSNTRLDSIRDKSAVCPTCEVVEAGSKRSGRRLIDNLGFACNVRSKRTYAMYWQCTVRPKGNQCKATVIERDGVFTQGLSIHNHLPQSVNEHELSYSSVVVTGWLSRSFVVVRDILCFSPRCLSKNTPEDNIFMFLIKILVRKQRFIQKSNGLMGMSCRTQVLLVTGWLSQSLVVVRNVFCFSPRYLTKNTPEDKLFVFLMKRNMIILGWFSVDETKKA